MELTHKESAFRHQPVLPTQQTPTERSPDTCHGSGLLSTLCSCSPLMSMLKGEGGLSAKRFNKEISPLPRWHVVFFSTLVYVRACWWIVTGCSNSQAGRTRKKKKKREMVFGETFTASRPQSGWSLTACAVWRVRAKAVAGSSPCMGRESCTHHKFYLLPAPERVSQVSQPGCFLLHRLVSHSPWFLWTWQSTDAPRANHKSQPTKHRPSRSWSVLMSHSPIMH